LQTALLPLLLLLLLLFASTLHLQCREKESPSCRLTCKQRQHLQLVQLCKAAADGAQQL
jgi:hypothetical protein